MNRKIKVLVVNDTPATRELLVRVVRRALPGADILDSEEFDDALEKTPEDLDIAVVDYHSGADSENGIVLLGKIKKKAPGCYLILVSKTVENQPDQYSAHFQLDADVSLRYVDTNPISLLREKIRQAKERSMAR